MSPKTRNVLELHLNPEFPLYAYKAYYNNGSYKIGSYKIWFKSMVDEARNSKRTRMASDYKISPVGIESTSH